MKLTAWLEVTGPTREAMELLGVFEVLSSLTCGGALVIWMSIGSLSKTESAEERAQKIMVVLCFGAAISLFGLHYAGGSVFGSFMLARVLAVVCIAVGLSASLNIKGKEVQGEPNPHQLMKARRERKEE